VAAASGRRQAVHFRDGPRSTPIITKPFPNMIENVMHHIGGVGIFGIISVLLFFAFFTLMVFWAVSLKKPYLNSMRGLPLEDETNSQPETFPQDSHE
jgi:hypothetical protein